MNLKLRLGDTDISFDSGTAEEGTEVERQVLTAAAGFLRDSARTARQLARGRDEKSDLEYAARAKRIADDLEEIILDSWTVPGR